MRLDNISARPIVVGQGLNALGIVRSLASARIRSDLLCGTDGAAPAAASRYGRVFRYRDTSADSIVDALIARAPASGSQLLILTEEEKVAAVSEHRNLLSEKYQLLLPPAATVTQLLNKNTFATAARAVGARVPRSVAINRGDALQTLDTLTAPLVIKPAGRQPNYLAKFPRAERAESLVAARGMLAARLDVSDGLIVQEWIDGPDEAIFFCLQFRPPDGSAPISFTGRKLLTWPRGTGGTARCTCAPAAAATLVAATNAFFSAAGVVGLASMEYKWCAVSEEYVMIEPTIGRSDHQEEIATLCGVNLPAAAWAWSQGKSWRLQTPRCAIWRDPLGEAHALAAGARIPPHAGVPVVDGLWRARDPGPWLADMSARARQRWRRFWP